MTTKAQSRKLAKPLLARNPDLALVDHFLVLKPLHHFVCGVLIDRRSGGPEPWPVMFVRHLFEEQTWLTHHWGQELGPGRDKKWRWSEPGEIEDLRCRLETEVFPHLRTIQTLDDMLNEVERVWPGLASKPRRTGTDIIRERPLAKLAFDVALGNLDVARLEAEHFLRRWPKIPEEASETIRAKFRHMAELSNRILADDRKSLVALLHEWEAATVRHFKMEHIWEPTPFPIETLGLV